MDGTFLLTRHDPGIVVASVLVACFASFLSLDLALRVRGEDRLLNRVWIAGGALVMGSGIWSMHFVGMVAFRLPFEVGYAGAPTALSWLAAVGVSALALWIASSERLGAPKLAAGALAMGAGICLMHYVGMSALRMEPGIVWHWGRVLASGVIAVGASAAALSIFFWMRRLRGRAALAAKLGASLVMGLAISGMHYTAMSAAYFPLESLCLSVEGLSGSHLGALVVCAALLLMSVTWLTSVVDARLQSRTARLARNLESTHAELLQANEQLRRMAFSDALTGLPNVSLFEDRLSHALTLASRDPSRRLAVLFVDLDGFKLVNDARGHAVGDRLLREVALRLREACRQGDTPARIGGDEFVLLLEDIAGAEEAVQIGERVVAALMLPVALGDDRVTVGASIGLAVFPDDGPAERIKSLADAAMYAAKRAGGNRVVRYHAALPTSDQTLDLLQGLREALHAPGQLVLHYQPKVLAATGQVSGVEALVRWRHPQRGLVPPGDFIPLAERTGLIVPLGAWVLDEACRQISEWAAQGRRLKVSVNLSAVQVQQPDFVATLEAALLRWRCDPRLLVCEFTETSAIEDALSTRKVIEALRQLGVRLSFDDFGTGYSSLAMLRQLHMQELKIDRSFVRHLDQDERARNLVEAIVRLAHALDMRVVAEGVERREECEALVAMGCDELQGYYFARPAEAAALMGELMRPDGERLAFARAGADTMPAVL